MTGEGSVANAFIEALRHRLSVTAAEPVALRETHLSWVLLVGAVAYKIKKPVHVPFVDFSTLQARRQACEEEVRLNRRWAPEIYLRVVPIHIGPAGPMLAGEGPVAEYAVLMRRFAEDELLAHVLALDQAGTRDTDAMAQTLARIHRAAPVATSSAPQATPDAISLAVDGLVDQLAPRLADEQALQCLSAVRQWVRQEEGRLAPLIATRLRDGHVRDCHGDLHLGNWARHHGRWMPFDGIEFDSRLRQIDVIADLAFLTMDLKAHERTDLAFAVLDTYLESTGDHEGVRLLRLHEVHRALVRALVTTMMPRDPETSPGTPPNRYLSWLSQHMAARGASPALVLMHGLSGSGKSTLARALAMRLPAIRARSDVERKRLLGLGPLDSAKALRDIAYGSDANEKTMQRLLMCATWALQADWSFIADATFLRHADRARFRQLALERGASFTIVHCEVPDELLTQRVRNRARLGGDASEADEHVLTSQRSAAEPLTTAEMASTLTACMARMPTPACLDALVLAIDQGVGGCVGRGVAPANAVN
jgi:aminoglycoside phosphotransferase family enzyme/predicted kinase